LFASFTQYTVTITPFQESVSNFNPVLESESQFLKPSSRSWSPTKKWGLCIPDEKA